MAFLAKTDYFGLAGDALECTASNDGASASVAEATVRQLAAAVGYALHGNDARALEDPEPPAREAEDVAGEEEGVPVWAGVLYRGAVLRLGTVEELRRMRESELLSLVVCAEAAAYGEGWRKSRRARARRVPARARRGEGTGVTRPCTSARSTRG